MRESIKVVSNETLHEIAVKDLPFATISVTTMMVSTVIQMSNEDRISPLVISITSISIMRERIKNVVGWKHCAKFLSKIHNYYYH
jgi:hypothetical protein